MLREHGPDISGYTTFDAIESRDLCMKAGKLGPEACFRGAAETMVNNEHGPVHATALCQAVPAQFTASCMRARDEAVSLL